MEENVPAGRCVVAVDGPSGSGKSTVSRRLATSLGGRYLDTGAMYRAITWAVLRSGVDLTDTQAVAKVAGEVDLRIGTDPTGYGVTVDGVNVETDIRGPEVTAAVSSVAAVPAVRALLVARQRDMITKAGRIVVEGRDIGSVVAPDADLKVYLTASAAHVPRDAAPRTPPMSRPPPPTWPDATSWTRPARPIRWPRRRTRWSWTPPSWASTRS